MTPLIDVIFLLMVFFIMTINFNQFDGVLTNQLPRLSSTQTKEPSKDYETIRLKIKMVKENSQLKIHLQERVVFNYEDLLLYLNQLPNDILIIFEPGDNVPYKHVIGVYNTCLKSKKDRIVFSL
jgi:biopolymer transport protein ExbD